MQKTLLLFYYERINLFYNTTIFKNDKNNNTKSLRVTMGIRRIFMLFLIGMFLCSATARSKVEMFFI